MFSAQRDSSWRLQTGNLKQTIEERKARQETAKCSWEICGLTDTRTNAKFSPVFQYLCKSDSCGPKTVGGVSGPGQQIGKGLLQAVRHFGPAKLQARDQLAQQELQQLQWGMENLTQEPFEVQLRTFKKS